MPPSPAGSRLATSSPASSTPTPSFMRLMRRGHWYSSYPQSAAASHHILREVERASSKRQPVIALRIDRAPLPAGLEYFLNSSQWLDTADADPSRAFPKLIDATRAALGSAASAAIDFSAKTVSSGAAVRFSKRDRVIAVIAVIVLILAFLAIAEKLVVTEAYRIRTAILSDRDRDRRPRSPL